MRYVTLKVYTKAKKETLDLATVVFLFSLPFLNR